MIDRAESDFELSVIRIPFLVWAAGLSCSLWSIFLAWRGHVPSFTGWPVPAEYYYATQSILGIPLIATCFWVLQKVLFLVAQADPVPFDAPPKGGKPTVTPALGAAYGGSILLLYVALDVLLYTFGGFEMLVVGVRIVMPLLATGCILGVAKVLHSRGYSIKMALKSSVLAVVSQGVLMGLFWR
ncbi:MAG: hypothetical protein GY822_09645 [Deltaproteobacteria bacterium]|nr:hypothetical protein [Deltaproteobacteria bacterium]